MPLGENFDAEVRLSHWRGSIDTPRDVGLTALKTLITLSSGAFIVLLPFIGNTAAQSRFSIPLSSLKLALSCFLGGIMLSLTSLFVAYLVAVSTSPYEAPDRWWHKAVVPLMATLALMSALTLAAGVIAVVNVRGRIEMSKAIAARCDDDTLWVDLADGRSLAVPLARFPRLLAASTEARASVRIGSSGEGLHWDALDEDISVAGLLAGRRDATHPTAA